MRSLLVLAVLLVACESEPYTGGNGVPWTDDAGDTVDAVAGDLVVEDADASEVAATCDPVCCKVCKIGGNCWLASDGCRPKYAAECKGSDLCKSGQGCFFDAEKRECENTP